jgi:Trk-type K+ transport system membrane component
VGKQVIAEDTIQSLLNLVYLSFLVNFMACLLLAASGVDVLTSIAAVAATMFNVGPGLGEVGGGGPCRPLWSSASSQQMGAEWLHAGRTA